MATNDNRAVSDRFKGILRGRFYGFPECCLGVHLDNKAWLAEDHPARGTGYIPCKECAKKPWEELKAEIIKNRICSAPFPDGHSKTCEEEYQAARIEGKLHRIRR